MATLVLRTRLPTISNRLAVLTLTFELGLLVLVAGEVVLESLVVVREESTLRKLSRARAASSEFSGRV